MEALQNYAIILIYPDGKQEKIPITNHQFHIEYFGEHLNNSKEFAKMCFKLRINPNDISKMNDNKDKITDTLGANNVLIIENINVFDIVQDSTFLDKNVCVFNIYFPEYFQNKEQLELYLKFLGDYSNELLHFGRYSRKENEHLDITREEMEEFIKDEKERLGIEELKR